MQNNSSIEWWCGGQNYDDYFQDDQMYDDRYYGENGLFTKSTCSRYEFIWEEFQTFPLSLQGNLMTLTTPDGKADYANLIFDKDGYGYGDDDTQFDVLPHNVAVCDIDIQLKKCSTGLSYHRQIL